MTEAIAQSLARCGLKAGLDELTVSRSGSTPELAKVVGDSLVLSTSANIEHAAQIAKALAFARESIFTDQERFVWTKALVSPGNERILEIENALRDSTSFEQAVETLERPVTRLTAVFLFNALIAGGTSFQNAKGADLSEWGSTAPYINGSGRISLIPLLGAYAPTEVYSVFGYAVEQLVANNLSRIIHSDVRDEFSQLVVGLFNGTN